MSPDGSSRTIIVHRGSNSSPDWSPDGTKIVFQRDRNTVAATDICIVNADGTGMKNITLTPARYEWTPVFSPDGTKILFSKGQGPGSPLGGINLWTMNLDGTSPTRITNTSVVAEFNADWQPI